MQFGRCVTAPSRRSRWASRSRPLLLSVAFLLKASEWNTFSESVLEQERRYPQLRFEQTGPVDSARFRATGPGSLSDVLS